MMPPIYVPVGDYFVRLERTPRPSRRYDGWTVAMGFCAGVLVGILALGVAI